MAKESFLVYLREIIGDMVDVNGNMRVTPIGATGKKNLSNNKIKLLSDIISLLRNTSIINKETRMYISNKYITIRGVNETLNEDITNTQDRINNNTTLSKIQYDKNRLSKIFGESMFVDILSKDMDISIYERIIAEQYVKYAGKSDIKKNLLINIPSDCMSSEIEEDAFEEFIGVISPYIKSQITFIENNLDISSCGYFNYLLSMPSLTGINKERSDRIKTLLQGEDTQNK